MGKKKSKNEGDNKNDNDEHQPQQKKKSENSEGGGKKDDGPATVVLKVRHDCECEGCATRIRKLVRGIEGVESVRGGDLSKLTLTGKLDPVKLREMVEQKTGKKVELVSPLPKKDKDNSKEKDGGGGGGEKKSEGKPEKKTDEKKSKEPPVTTAVMKVNLHCQGCIQKIRKAVTKTPGYQGMSIDEQKDLVTVKGTMDMKALTETLKERLKRAVEIIPPKKEGGEKKEKEKEKRGGGGGGEKGKGGEGGDGGGNDVGGQPEENRIQYVQYGYPNSYMYGYGLGYPVEQHHAPQMFSDENPNACSIM